MPERFGAMSARFFNPSTERNKTMKLTKAEIKQKQEDLVKVLLQLKRLGESKKSLTAALADDFEANEEKYRNGIVTASGILLRKPSWNFDVKPIVEVA